MSSASYLPAPHVELEPEVAVRLDRLCELTHGVVGITAGHRIWYADNGAQALWGYTWRELQGQDVDLLLHPDDRPGHHGRIDRFFSGMVTDRRMGGAGKRLRAYTKGSQEVAVTVYIASVADTLIAAVMRATAEGPSDIPFEARLELDALRFTQFALVTMAQVKALKAQVDALQGAVAKLGRKPEIGS